MKRLRKDGSEAYSEFHHKLEKMIEENWGVAPEYSEPFSWGYNSTGFYIRDREGKEFTAILADDTEKKRFEVEKNIAITKELDLSVETPKHMDTKDGGKLLEIPQIKITKGSDVRNKILVFYPFLRGIPPFDMTLDIVRQSADVLREIHLLDPLMFDVKLEEIPAQKKYFLHGDPTPSNFLVSYGEIAAIVDFELSLIGPAEYDLARMAVFSWFRMKDKPFLKILKTIKESYEDKTQLDLLKEFSLLHCQTHLRNVVKHESVHENPKVFEKEVKFAQEMLDKMQKEIQ